MQDKLTEEERAILKKMKEDRSQYKAKQALFWEQDYPKLSLNKKKELWMRNIWQDIQMQSNAVGLDIFYMFSKENYLDWKSKYSDIDEILNFVITNISGLYQDTSLIKELNNKIGRIKHPLHIENMKEK